MPDNTTMPKPAITSFTGEYRFLSNFYRVDVELGRDGDVYPTVENAYQAAKTTDRSERIPFRSCTPGQAKRMGRRLELRPDWEEVKVDIMRHLLRQKFASGPLARLLLATGDAELVEGNTWNDTFWGVCRGKGRNMLGKLLMETRKVTLNNDSKMSSSQSRSIQP